MLAGTEARKTNRYEHHIVRQQEIPIASMQAFVTMPHLLELPT
jgi:hypothetical protein